MSLVSLHGAMMEEAAAKAETVKTEAVTRLTLAEVTRVMAILGMKMDVLVLTYTDMYGQYLTWAGHQLVTKEVMWDNNSSFEEKTSHIDLPANMEWIKYNINTAGRVPKNPTINMIPGMVLRDKLNT